jgi:hypothetical protein
MSRVLILMHEHLRPKRPHYLVDALAGAWRADGIDVAYAYGPRGRPPADLLLPHVDLTRTPADYVECIRSYPAAVNRDVVDVSKRRISRNLLREEEEYGGPVVVKTDENAGGGHECRLLLRRHPVLGRLWLSLAPVAERLCGRPLAWRRRLREYPVYESLAQVPRGVFTNGALVVERFLPEREGDRWFVRYYLCLGDHERSSRVVGTGPFLKRSSCEPANEGLPVPDEVWALRRELGLDYGKIDYMVHDGQVVILDVNRTPAQPGTPEATARAVRDLAGGIWSLLPR